MQADGSESGDAPNVDVAALAGRLAGAPEEAFDARKELRQAVWASPDASENQGQTESGRRALANDLAAALAIATAPAARAQLCELLGLVATETDVPAIAALASEPALRDAACGALERIGDDASRQALVKLLAGDVETKLGVVHALSMKHDEHASALFLQLRDADGRVRVAALRALSHLNYAELDDVMVASCQSADPYVQRGAERARLRLAITLRTYGEVRSAYRILRSLVQSSKNERHKLAAERALASFR